MKRSFFLKRFILISIESNNRIKKKKDRWKDGWSSEISKKISHTP